MKLSFVLAIAAVSLTAQNKAIDVRRSSITIHVGKSGVFSAAGHEHWVSAPIVSGEVNDADPARVELKVDAAKMTVKPDSKLSPADQAKVQQDMQEKVLESSRYPEIVFRSSRVTKASDGQWEVAGMLTLHGVTKPVTASVARKGDAYVGRAMIRQTEFGIKPISAGGGAVKVKNELSIEFEIVTGKG